MKRIILLFVLILLAAGLLVIVVISLINGEVYGRWGSILQMEDFPAQYWIGIFLMMSMVGTLIYAINKTWHDV